MFLDESSHLQFLLNGNNTWCQERFRHSKDLQPIRTDLRKEKGEFKLMQDLICTQGDIQHSSQIKLQFGVSVKEEANKAPPTNVMT